MQRKRVVDINKPPSPRTSPSRDRSTSSGTPKISDIILDADCEKWDAETGVWVRDEEEGCLSAKLINIKSSDITNMDSNTEIDVQLEDGTERTVKAADLDPMNPPKFNKCDDLANLSHLNESAVFSNLRDRFYSDLIYTYSGLFLVAINPWRRLDLYTDDIVQMYRGRMRDELPPHIFAVCDEAYRDMLENTTNQTILITGESGAGKTVNTNKVIQYFTKTTHIAGSNSNHIESKIIEATPILESFGNAKTVKNNNSSRFGKFIRIQFNKSGQIVGADIEHYLLEKGRVVHHEQEERTFHIFYQMLYGMPDDLKEEFELGDISQYQYLKGIHEIDSVDDAKDFDNVRNSMNVIGITESEQRSIWKILMGILLFGNLEFYSSKSDEGSCFKDSNEVDRLTKMLGISTDEFQTSMLKPTIKAGDNIVNTTVTPEKAISVAQALAKGIYERLFKWIVERINSSMQSKSAFSNFIGVLDIAGFEIFKKNSFEQLCINYTNERLQQFFNHRMFVLEQKIYQQEGIEWEFVDFGLDLQPTIDLIEQPMGILSILDEECLFPKASDETFVQKLMHRHDKKHEKFSSTRLAPNSFICKHYAGKVSYDTQGWLVKNKDPINENVTKLFAKSSDNLLSSLFKDYADSKSPSLPSFATRRKGSQFITVSQRHRVQLNDLMYQLQKTTPHFVRCIIPNNEKKPGLITAPLVLNQLRCNGVLEGIRITRLGFPSRVAFGEFKQRYAILASGALLSNMDAKKASISLLKTLGIASEEYRIGKSKVFMKSGTLARLEEQRNIALSRTIIAFQSRCRAFLARKTFSNSRQREYHIRLIQRNVREYLSLRDDPWWKLYTQIKPLMAFHAQDKKERQLKNQIRELEKKLEEEYAQREEMKRSFDDERKRMMEQNDEVSTALEEMIEALTRMEETREAQAIEIGDLKVEVDQVNEANLVLDKKLELTEKSLADLQNENEEQCNKIMHITTAHRKQINAFEELKLQLQSDVEESERKLGQKSTEALELAEKLSTMQEEKVALEKLSQDLQKKVKEHSQRLKLAETELEAKEDSNQKLTNQLQTMQVKNEEDSNEIEKLLHDLKTTKRQLGNVENEVKEKSDHLAKAKCELREYQEKNKELSIELETLREEIVEQSKANVESVKAQMEAQSNKSEKKIEEERQKHKSELISLKKDFEEKIEEKELELEVSISRVKKLEAEKEQIENDVMSIRQRMDETVKAKQQTEKHLRQLVSENRDLQGQLETSKSEIDSLSRELDEKAQVKVSMDRLAESREENAKAISQLKAKKEEEIKSLQMDKENVLRQYDELMMVKQALESELESMMDQMESQDHQIRELGKSKEKMEVEIRKYVRMEKTMRELEEECDRLVQMLTEANGKNEELTVEIDSCRRRNAELNEKCENLSVKLEKSLSRRVNDVKPDNELTTLNRVLEDQKSQVVEAKQQAEELKRELIREKSYSDELRTELKECRDKIKSLMLSLKQEKQASIDRENDEIQRLKVELLESKGELELTQSDYDQLQAEKSHLDLILADKNLQLESVEQKLNEELSKNYETESRETERLLKDELQKLREREIDFESRNASLISERNRLETKIHNLEQMIIDGNETVQDLRMHLKQGDLYSKQLKLDLDSKIAELEDVHNLRHLLEMKLKDSGERINQLKTKAELSEEDRQRSEAIANQMKCELESIQRLAENERRMRVDMENEFCESQEELEAVRKKLEESTQELKSANAKLLKTEQKLERLKSETELKISREKSGLEKQLFEAHLEVSNLQSSTAIAESKIRSLSSEISELSKRLLSSDTQRESLQKSKLKLTRENNKISEQLKSLLTENQQLTQSISSLQESVENLTQEISTQKSAFAEISTQNNLLNIKIETLEFELENSRQDHSLLLNRHEAIQSDKYSLLEQTRKQRELLDTLEYEKSQLKSSVEQLKSHTELQLAKVENERDNLKRNFDEEISSLKTRLEKTLSQLDLTTSEKNDIEEKYSQASSELTKQIQKYSKTLRKLQETTKLFHHLQSRTQQLEQQCDESMELLDILRREHEQLLDESKPLKLRIVDLESANDHLAREIGETRGMIESRDEQISRLKSENDNLKAGRTEITEKLDQCSSDLTKIQTEFDKQLSELNELKLSYSQECSKSDQLTYECQEHEKTIHRLKAELELLVNNNHEKNQSSIKRLQERLTQLQTTTQTQTHEISTLQDEKRHLERQLYQLRLKNEESLRQVNVECEQKYEERLKVITGQQWDLETQLKGVRAKLNESQEENRRLQMILSQERLKLRNLSRENDCMRSKDLFAKFQSHRDYEENNDDSDTDNKDDDADDENVVNSPTIILETYQ